MTNQDQQIGKLIAQVERLNESVKRLDDDVTELRDNVNRGRGFVIGMLCAAGAAGAGISSAFHKLFG